MEKHVFGIKHVLEIESGFDVGEETVFLDHCVWALCFGGPFHDELLIVASEILKDAQNVEVSNL